MPKKRCPRCSKRNKTGQSYVCGTCSVRGCPKCMRWAGGDWQDGWGCEGECADALEVRVGLNPEKALADSEAKRQAEYDALKEDGNRRLSRWQQQSAEDCAVARSVRRERTKEAKRAKRKSG